MCAWCRLSAPAVPSLRAPFAAARPRDAAVPWGRVRRDRVCAGEVRLPGAVREASCRGAHEGEGERRGGTREGRRESGWTPGVPSGVHRMPMLPPAARSGQGPFGPVFRVRCRFGPRRTADHHLDMIGRAENPYAHSDAPCRLLLVSDHRASSDALGTHLSHHGFTIVGREPSARAAGEAARREHPDVVLIDAAVHEGWQEVVRSLDAIPKDHIAVLAAYWSTDARRAAAASGIGATLLKRVEGAELVNRLRALAEDRPEECATASSEDADGAPAVAAGDMGTAPLVEPGPATAG